MDEVAPELPPAGDILNVSERVQIPLREFQMTFVRSSGPGGQNVNKVNTKVQLRWPVMLSAGLPEDVKNRFVQQQRTRITTEGEFLITSQRYRDQKRNIDDCLEKLKDLLTQASFVPTRRKPTRPTRGSVRRRLEAKRRRSSKKRQRRFERDD